MHDKSVAEKLRAIVREQFAAQLRQNVNPWLTSLAYSTDP